MRSLILILLLFLAVVIYKTLSKIPTPPLSSTIITPTVTLSPNNLVYPIAEFKQRITKKFFGTYVTPQNPPVQPEKFTGFHTGVDVEYGGITTDVSVFSIDNGQVIYSGYVSGYGGFVAVQYSRYIGIYGHLKPSSLIANKSIVKKGDKIAVLGQAYSSETDGERRHLHFAILKGTKLDFRGYVQKQSELSLWINPLTLFP